MYDVVIVGYGPVSQALAIMLGRQGRSVAIVERWQERYPLPRAVCIDHEMFRMLSDIGLRDKLPAVSHPAPPYRWFNAQWKELLSIDWSAESISGGTEVNFIHQPTLEAMFDVAVSEQQTVDVNLGWEATEVGQDDDSAYLVARDMQTGESRTWRGRYLVGADGANSLTRRSIGSAQEDRGFQADWLVIDILPNPGVTLDIPPAAQYCNPERPTTIVPAGVRDGQYFRRWEFMRLPHESVQDIENEATAWALLKPWVTPDQAQMVRHKVYTFRSLIASKWRERRLLIAGDAAHVMPPFMGQGMCAGLRDGWNLAWKLDLILDGKSDDRLLDTYQEERRPHASDIIDLSMYLGKVICIPDKEEAARRDAAFFDRSAPPPPPFPSLTDGVLRKDADGALEPLAGKLSPHGMVRRLGHVGRFDDLVGLGWVLLTSVRDPLRALSPEQHEVAASLGLRTVWIDAEGSDQAAGAIVDVDGKYADFLKTHALAAILIRPDFYIYGTASEPAGIGALIEDLTNDLRRRGVMVRQAGSAHPLHMAG
ncbi:bifunctional 3-(3-hydroxy-phenyl)propionate/3-hydroxycinnamic acid hydroxylase [Pseudoxanthomonas sp. JBR18]|uniref:bifunctional 3-(3-hydroxy-phenyl)propionate/3-hydroxycinnamic acid hydroxylase MhpA n=1 Tax=Pseudoxanthomonas sp. JBR18 TaxID=2969308 RepID=UPI0023063DC7|nr:bifunctional 3-(3-hydroxy-phenyl)propionate/3-hydroxycinnamic acid hydroxylase [Pseudoxanthomonas sp. JBR18]WCE06233.1 bifunctional 3-(3-hydroxy-phenyl)propionate/3-hydroxycinnamic acid hydroxylase [Pseudoxanthomonas sp. JBR18]